jgi:hypothetical protein
MPLLDTLALPVHPRTGLTAIGLRRNGDPIWPVLGGSGEGEPADTGGDEAPADAADDGGTDSEPVDEPSSAKPAKGDDDGEGPDDKRLGPAGEQALQRMKEERRLAMREKRAAIREREALQAELDKVKAEKAKRQARDGDEEQDDELPDLDAIRKEAAEAAKAEARMELLGERVSDRVEILAAKRFQDAEDALAHLMRAHEVSDFLDGEKVDVEAIKEALDELLERKPYLAVPAQGEAKRFKGSGDGGAKPNKPARPKSIGEALARKLSSPTS